MKIVKYTIATALSVALLIGCDRPGKPEDTDTPADSAAVVVVVTDTVDSHNAANTSLTDDDYDTYNPWTNDSLKILQPLMNVHLLAWRAIQAKNNLKNKIDENTLSDQEETHLQSLEDIAWNAIKAYEKSAREGLFVAIPASKLLGITRSSYEFGDEQPSPPIEAYSKFDFKGDFFFLGGAPFISKKEPDENNTVYYDDNKKPEIRFVSDVPENTQFLITWLCNLRKEHFNLSYGPPLNDYEYGEQHINTVGSIKHELVNRTPAMFLTEKGIVPAQLVSITVQLIPTYNCSSDKPVVEFACKQPIEANDILAIWIPAATTPPATCTITHSDNVWTADLDGDGIPDMAALNETFNGASADNMNLAYWYLNVDGTWEIIDRSREVDCT